jgi:hypothetical protein
MWLRRNGSQNRQHCRRSRHAALFACLAATGMLVVSCSKDGSTSARRAHSTTTLPTGQAITSTPKPKEGPAHGNVAVTVPTGTPAPTLAPVAMNATASFGDHVDARLAKLAAIDAKAALPGERSGPAVAVTAEITNGSNAPIDLGGVTVDMTSANGAPFTQVTPFPATAFSGTLDPGKTATGRYVFTINDDARSDVRVSIKYSAPAPTAVFAGSVPHV